eukprot:567611-Amphidinium_carterae.1
MHTMITAPAFKVINCVQGVAMRLLKENNVSMWFKQLNNTKSQTIYSTITAEHSSSIPGHHPGGQLAFTKTVPRVLEQTSTVPWCLPAERGDAENTKDRCI